MTTTLRPHDLIWLTARDALEGITESWVDAAWHAGLPVVVRRDVDNEGRIPVGVRGLRLMIALSAGFFGVVFGNRFGVQSPDAEAVLLLSSILCILSLPLFISLTSGM